MAELKEIQTFLRGVGLLPAEGNDPEKVEPGAAGAAVVDNTLEVTKRAKTALNQGGLLGAGGVAAATIWADVQKNTTVFAVTIASVAVLAAAWGLGIAWLTEVDARARAAVSVEKLKARGVVTAALIEAQSTHPHADGDARTVREPLSEGEVFTAVAAALSATGVGTKHVRFTTDSDRTGPVTSASWDGKGGVDLHVDGGRGKEDDCGISKVRKVELS